MSEEAKTHVHVIKRNGEEVTFDLSKIENAIKAANNEVAQTPPAQRISGSRHRGQPEETDKNSEMSHAVHVEDIQDMVETGYHGDARI